MSKIAYTDEDLADLRRSGVEVETPAPRPKPAVASQDSALVRQLTQQLSRLPANIIEAVRQMPMTVSVPEQGPPTIVINPPKPCRWKFTVERDHRTGQAIAYTAEPLD